LIYSTIAIAVSPQTIGNYWFLIVGGWVVLSVSYVAATLLKKCFFDSTINQRDFMALRVACTYPNIVALPILIFPSLCEFAVVYEGYATSTSTAMTSEAPSSSFEETMSSSDLQRECNAQSTTMIFCYFFAWSLAFWTFGNPQLMKAAHDKTLGTTVTTAAAACTDIDIDNNNNKNNNNGSTQRRKQLDSDKANLRDPCANSTTSNDGKKSDHKKDCTDTDASSVLSSTVLQCAEEGRSVDHRRDSNDDDDDADASSSERSTTMEKVSDPASQPNENKDTPCEELDLQRSNTPTIIDPIEPESKSKTTTTEKIWKSIQPFWIAIKQTTTSPGFIAMVLAFITACIPPLQRALFEPGGALRFLGSAVEALGTASSPISTMVVAASLVPPLPVHADHEQTQPECRESDDEQSSPIIDERPGMTDPNFGPYQRPRRRRRQHDRRSSRLSELRRSMRSSSIRLIQAIPRSTPEMRRLHLWFNLSRLVVAPAVVVGLILALDCSSSTILNDVPNLAKLVIIVNAALPGALIVVVLLKSREECADTAAAVSKVYLPSYLMSIVSIGAWCAVGLWITLPDENGNTICHR
jgi:predicted permease